MADAEEIRAWARANGHDVSDRGKVPAAVQQAYDAAHPAPPSIPSHSSGPAWDDGGVTEADFPEPDDEPEPERPPRAVRPGRGRAKPAAAKGKRGGRFGGWLKLEAPKNRTNLSEFASDTWRDLALITTPIPPLSKVFAVQAPYAGVVFDEAVKGTPVDIVLQPVAKYSASLRALNGLVGPPLFTLALCTRPAESWRQDEETGLVGPADQQTAMLLTGLRYSLVQMLRVSNLNAEKIAERALEDADMERQVDRLIGVILGLPGAADAQPPAPPAATQQPGAEPIVPTSVFRYPPEGATDMTMAGADPSRMGM